MSKAIKKRKKMKRTGQKRVKQTSPKRKIISIGSKVLIMTIILLVVSLSVVGISANLKARDILKSTYQSDISQLIVQTGNAVDNYFKKYDAIAEIIATNPNVRKASVNDQYNDNLIESMVNIYESDEDISSIYYLSKGGTKFQVPFNVETAADGTEISNDSVIEGREAEFDHQWYYDSIITDQIVWSKPHLDEETKQTVITLSKAVYNTKGTALYGSIGIDITLDRLAEMLNDIKIGEKGYPVLLSGDLVTLTHANPEIIGSTLPIPEINNAIKSGFVEPVDYKWEEEGVLEDKFAVYHKIQGKELYILATMYTSEIKEQTSAIIFFVLIIAVSSLIVAAIVSQLFAKTISRPINSLLKVMEKVKDGDLSTDINIKSNDEIGVVGEYFKDAISSISNLLGNVQGVSTELSESATTLAATAEETSASSEEVARTVEEIAGGATNQASDAEEGAIIAKDLSIKFQELSENKDGLVLSTNNVVKANDEGINAIKVLRDKTELSNKANTDIEIVIAELNNKTQNITNILNAISSIADQTNLLALNASIEAARAGEHGRGFAVVADEIRKLAEESSKSAEEIRDIVTNIQSDSKKTVNSMNDLKGIASEQSEAVDLVGGTFDIILTSVDDMSDQIDKIGSSVNSLEEDKDAIVNSIENISAVSEETAAAAEEVTATMAQQTIAVEDLSKSAEVLNEISAHLNDELSKFTLK